jgi:UDP-N-acetylglucosamine diphosphorylase / glucose-1-phosphate thymidylyltransferase / UDP-N-acetylgalactosamine diphosphorylase / glucosamine-1-phosphate N-acetyltransferase / galactosamine-1-phosphate N-acetyltransferase
MINIVIPMAGLGSRFVLAGYEKPKPFIDVKGKSMIERVLENLDHPNAKFILIARQEHIDKEFELVEKIKNKYNVIFISIDKVTEGAACTILYAREFINNETPLVLANSDQIIDIKLKDFIDDCKTRNLDGSIITFEDKFKDTKWSFAKIDNYGLVEMVKEKEAISKNATVGIYFFKHGRDFVDAAIDMIIEGDRSNNEFYTCPTYNYLIRSGKKIGIFNIDFQDMHGIGTPADLEKYLEGNFK